MKTINSSCEKAGIPGTYNHGTPSTRIIKQKFPEKYTGRTRYVRNIFRLITRNQVKFCLDTSNWKLHMYTKPRQSCAASIFRSFCNKTQTKNISGHRRAYAARWNFVSFAICDAGCLINSPKAWKVPQQCSVFWKDLHRAILKTRPV